MARMKAEPELGARRKIQDKPAYSARGKADAAKMGELMQSKTVKPASKRKMAGK